MKLLINVAIVLLVLSAMPASAGLRPDGSPNRAGWMVKGSFGVMTHYIIQPKGSTPSEKAADLNRAINSFDLDDFIQQIRETGADWVIFTLGQNSGYLCSPNAYLEAKASGMTPRRDLVREIGERLHLIGKRLILYIPSAENADPSIKLALRVGTEGYDARYFSFLREYSARFRGLCDGWWLDSCGNHEDTYWLELIAALRTGNKETIVAFNGGELSGGRQINPICRFEDYLAGEIHLLEEGRIRRDFLPPGGDIIVAGGKLRLRGQEAHTYMPDGPFIDNIQWHGLLPLDLTFNPAIPNQFCHYTDKELFGFVCAVKAVGGAITINVPIDVTTGHILADSHAQLVRLGKWIRSR